MEKPQKTHLTLLIAIIAVIMVFGLSLFVNTSMQEMDPAIRNENMLDAIDPLSPSQNIDLTQETEKTTITNYWDPEAVIAKQIERTLSFGQTATLESIANNIEANLAYNRNPAAAYFYLAYAYEKSGHKDKAQEIYQLLREKYTNQQIALYIFDVSRIATSYRNYYASLYEESLIREYQLTNDPLILELVKQSTSTFHYSQQPGFSYRDLVKDNNLALSSDFIQKIPFAENRLQEFLGLALQKEYSLSELQLLTTGSLSEQLAVVVPQLQELNSELLTEELKVTLRHLRKVTGGYQLVFIEESSQVTYTVINLHGDYKIIEVEL